MWSIFEHLCLLIHIEFRQKQNSFSRRFHLKKNSQNLPVNQRLRNHLKWSNTRRSARWRQTSRLLYCGFSLLCTGQCQNALGPIASLSEKKKSGNAQSFRSLRVNLEKSRCCIPSTKANMLAESSLNDMWVRSSRGRSLYGRQTKPRNWTITASESPITW